MGTKLCSKCGEFKDLSAFNKRTSSKDGYNWHCRDCVTAKRRETREGYDSAGEYAKAHREEQAKWKAARVAELKVWLNDLRETTPCADCNHYFPAVCMDFDHVRGKKKMDVMKMAGQGYARAMVEDEVSKCELVCANCHRLRTHASDRERPWYNERRKYDRSNWGL